MSPYRRGILMLSRKWTFKCYLNGSILVSVKSLRARKFSRGEPYRRDLRDGGARRGASGGSCPAGGGLPPTTGVCHNYGI